MSTRALTPPKPRIIIARTLAWALIVTLLIVAIAAFSILDISWAQISRALPQTQRFLASMWPLSFPEPGKLLSLILMTVGMVTTATGLSAIISLPIAYCAAGNTAPNGVVRAIARFITVLTRSIPDAVLAMLLVFFFSLGTLPGIIAMAIHSIGMIGKLFADAIEQIDEGPTLAIRAAGGSRSQQFWSGIMPQVFPSFVATMLHRNDINLRGSVILGYVGVAGLGCELGNALKVFDYRSAIGYALVIFLLCVAMELLSSSVRAKLLGDTTAKAAKSRAVPHSFASVQEAMHRPWDAARIRTLAGIGTTVIVLVLAVVFSNITWGDFITMWGRFAALKIGPLNFGPYTTEQVITGLRDTVLVALAAALITVVFSLILGSLAARNVAPNRGVRLTSRVILTIVRGVPELVLAIVLIIISGLGATAGVIALGFGGIGLLGKLFADSIEEIDRGPGRALLATGATRGQVYTAATIPQSMQALIGHTFYLIDTNIRSATLLGIVGVGGIGYYLVNSARVSAWGQVFAFVLLILAVVLIVEGLAIAVRKALR